MTEFGKFEPQAMREAPNAPFQFFELHRVPASQDRVPGYPISEDKSGGV
jgi:hypothetical protein